jgi:P27 family predicted phage terminase small subunit
MPGPPRTPTQILEARGSWLAPKRQKEGEPQVKIEAPACPPILKGEARQEWKRAVRWLLTMRVLSRADRGVLTTYCLCWQKLIDLDDLLGATDHSDPLWKTLCVAQFKAMEMLNKAGARLGFSPADRARLRPPEADKPKTDGKARFFAGAN